MATVDIPPWEWALVIDGDRVKCPSRHSIQIEEGVHIEVVGAFTLEDLLVHHPWRFINHSCDPNTRLSGRTMVALRAIGAGEEITYNYNTTEWELAEPFACRCGSNGCAGTIRGFAFLSQVEREGIRALLAPHLLRRLATVR